jgi:hypothetical protein
VAFVGGYFLTSLFCSLPEYCLYSTKPHKKPAPNFSEAGFADLPLDRRMSEYARGHGKFSVFVVGGECRRGSCRDASGFEQGGKVVLPNRPFIATQIFCGVEVGGEAFEVAAWSEIVVVDSCGASCLAFGLLCLFESGLSHIGGVLAVSENQVAVAVEDLTQTGLEGAHEVALCLVVIDAAETAERHGFEDRQAACDEIGGGITKGLAKGGDLAKSFVDIFEFLGGSDKALALWF